MLDNAGREILFGLLGRHAAWGSMAVASRFSLQFARHRQCTASTEHAFSPNLLSKCAFHQTKTNKQANTLALKGKGIAGHTRSMICAGSIATVTTLPSRFYGISSYPLRVKQYTKTKRMYLVSARRVRAPCACMFVRIAACTC